LTDELEDSSLFVSRQPFYFFDDLNRCHAGKLPAFGLRRKRRGQCLATR
jgi:hypothetical protein